MSAEKPTSNAAVAIVLVVICGFLSLPCMAAVLVAFGGVFFASARDEYTPNSYSYPSSYKSEYDSYKKDDYSRPTEPSADDFPSPSTEFKSDSPAFPPPETFDKGRDDFFK